MLRVIIAFFMVCKIAFFGFIEVLDLKGILNMVKKINYVSHGMR